MYYMKGVEWDYFDKFKKIKDKYMLDWGEGETIASQLCTAINKLVYKWYNDGDVFDTTHIPAGSNDLSSYANWIYQNIPQSREILNKIEEIKDYNSYENLLKELADTFLNEEILSNYNTQKKIGTIYKCEGRFEVNYDEDYYK